MCPDLQLGANISNLADGIAQIMVKNEGSRAFVASRQLPNLQATTLRDKNKHKKAFFQFTFF